MLRILILIIGITLCTSQSNAQPLLNGFSDIYGTNGGSTVFNSLRLPAGAGSLARNPIAIPGSREASDMSSSNASSALITHYDFSVSHLEWFSGLRSEYLAGVYPILAIGTVGTAARIFTATDFGPSRDIDENPTKPFASEAALSLSFARQIVPDIFSAGIAVQPA